MTAYQVSLKGLQLIEVMGDDLCEQVDKTMHVPNTSRDPRNLMQVESHSTPPTSRRPLF